MNFQSRRRLQIEGLETRTLLAGDVAAAVEEVAASPAIFGDANSNGIFDQSDLVEVFQAGKYGTGEKAHWNEGDWNGDELFDSTDLTVAFQAGNYLRDNVNAKAGGHHSQQNWPDQISLPKGFEPEGIELGKGQEFFVGGFSYSSFFGPQTEESEYAGAIYKGNLRTGAGAILVEPTDDLLIAGLSYDPRTDYIYAATPDAGALGGPLTGAGVNIYHGTTGALIKRFVFGEGMVINDLLVTNKAVYATDSLSSTLYKIPLEHGGQPSSDWEAITMDDGFGFIEGTINANGLVGDFDGNQLVVVNRASGKLFHVDTESGAATEITVEGEQSTFPTGDGLFMRGRTLYIMQNQFGPEYVGKIGKIAVVQLSGDLTRGTFVKDIENGNFANPTTIIGHGDSIYAVNSQAGAAIFGDPSEVQSQVVKVKK